ncbi:MAG: YciI family protein [Allorhizobium sp.]
MLILSLSYRKSAEDAAAQMQSHLAWVKEGYDRGWFLASGRKVPRTGGLIVSRGDRTALEAYVAEDPFVIHGIAAYEITEVALTTVAPGFEGLKD